MADRGLSPSDMNLPLDRRDMFGSDGSPGADEHDDEEDDDAYGSAPAEPVSAAGKLSHEPAVDVGRPSGYNPRSYEEDALPSTPVSRAEVPPGPVGRQQHIPAMVGLDQTKTGWRIRAKKSNKTRRELP